jgi:hypothetical protein
VKTLFLHIVFLFSSSGLYSQSIIWENLWGTGQQETGIVININRDSTFIISGIYSSPGYYPCFYMKMDKNGNYIFQKYGRNTYTGEQDIHERPNGGFIFTGAVDHGFSGGYNTTNNFLQKINVNGDTTWAKTYPNSYTQIFPTRMAILPSEDYVITSYGANDNRLYNVQRIDSSGNVKWAKEFASALNTYSGDLIINEKGNIILAGTSMITHYSSNVLHPYLMEISPWGDSIRSASIVVDSDTLEEGIDWFENNIVQTQDGGYVFSGYKDGGSFTQGFILKIDSAFNLEWKYVYPFKHASGTVLFGKVHELSDSSYVILATDDLNYTNKFKVVKISKTGTYISTTTYNSAIGTMIVPYDWEFLSDGSAIIVGRDYGSQNAYFARIGNVGIASVVTDTCKTFTPSFTVEQIGDSLQFINTSNGGYDYARQSIWKFADSTSTNIFNAKIQSGILDSVWARLTATNGYGCTGTVAKKVKVNQVTAINQNAVSYSSLSVNVFPNPFSQSTVFKVNNNSNSSYQLKILNSLGEEISSYSFSGKEFTLNASGFSSGLYMYVLRDGEGKMKSGKLVVE